MTETGGDLPRTDSKETSEAPQRYSTGTREVTQSIRGDLHQLMAMTEIDMPGIGIDMGGGSRDTRPGIQDMKVGNFGADQSVNDIIKNRRAPFLTYVFLYKK